MDNDIPYLSALLGADQPTQFNPTTTSARISVGLRRLRNHASRILRPPEEICREVVATHLPDGQILPPTKSFEVYYIECIVLQTVPLGEREVVAFPPEFMYLLDVGFESMVGITISFRSAVYGDPSFPDFSSAALRSIRSRTPDELLCPDVTGEIIIHARSGVSDSALRASIGVAVALDPGNGPSYTAKCSPFRERTVCRDLMDTLSEVVSFAEPVRVVRLIDVIPGWQVDRVF